MEMEKMQSIINENEDVVYNKKISRELVDLFNQFDEKKANRIDDCASTLIFKMDLDTGNRKLVSANFCQDRFCPECSKRKSRVMYHNLKQVLEKSYNEQKQNFIHLVLSLKNCKKENLNVALDQLLGGFKRMMKRKKFKTSINGWYRNLEVTYNEKEDTLHPHLHVILVVDDNYFKRYSQKYLTQSYIKREFGDACRVDYLPTVYIKKVYSKEERNNLHGLIAEASKYVTKVSDVLNLKNKDLKLELLKALSTGLHGRRMSSYGGTLKEIFKQLKLQNEEEADLLCVENEEIELGNNCVYGIFNYNKKEEKYVLVRVMDNFAESWEYWRERREERKVIRQRIHEQNINDFKKGFQQIKHELAEKVERAREIRNVKETIAEVEKMGNLTLNQYLI